MGSSTIYALSSGNGPSGIAVIRFSGPGVRFAFEMMVGVIPENRKAIVTNIFFPGEKTKIDKGVVLFFKGPNSFTGEDCGEFHVHGGMAVIKAVLSGLSSLVGFVAAEPGGFSRRAFTNGKLDLTEVEGLSDLIAAETEKQRALALSHSSGQLSEIYNDWRTKLIEIRALIEAEIDFADEEDIPESVNSNMLRNISRLSISIKKYLDDGRRGEIVRDGFKIVLMGSPNSGKSSLLNKLASRDAAIVSPHPGTTRDIIDVNLDISGYQVMVSDTAGLRETSVPVEIEGINRALDRGNLADLVVWLNPVDAEIDEGKQVLNLAHDRIVVLRSKSDLCSRVELNFHDVSVSTVKPGGVDAFVGYIRNVLENSSQNIGDVMLGRQRHRESLEIVLEKLAIILDKGEPDIELVTENLRIASDQIGKLVGKIDVEDLLDQVFSEFCIGK